MSDEETYSRGGLIGGGSEVERGSVTGLPMDLPPGQHPFDWYLSVLTNVLGHRKTAAYLGVSLVKDDDSEGQP